MKANERQFPLILLERPLLQAQEEERVGGILRAKDDGDGND